MRNGQLEAALELFLIGLQLIQSWGSGPCTRLPGVLQASCLQPPKGAAPVLNRQPAPQGGSRAREECSRSDPSCKETSQCCPPKEAVPLSVVKSAPSPGRLRKFPRARRTQEDQSQVPQAARGRRVQLQITWARDGTPV